MRLAAAGLSLAMAVAVSALTIIPTEPVRLGRSDRAILERLACRGPHGKPSISASMSTPAKRCLSVTFAEACDAGGPVPLDVESDECFDEF